jgi:hypothetical protein
MRRAITWIVGIVAVLAILGLVLYGRSDRQAYRAAKGAIEKRVALRQEAIDMAVQMATKSVDMALVMAGNLPAQTAKADLIQQGIQDIGNLLNEGAALKGELATAKLDASIQVFNTTLELVDDASKQAENPEVKSALDRIYGILVSTKDQLVQTVLKVSN